MEALSTGNCARFAAKPLTHSGTPAPVWLASFNHEPLPPLDLTGCPGLVVVAAHPDDETLGLGGTIAQLVASGVDVKVVSVSDGGAALPNATSTGRIRMAATRQHELRRATGILGVTSPMSLSLPDGQLTDYEDRITDSLVEILDGTAEPPWCAATWRGDGHPDHEVVGRAAATACARTNATLLEFPIWMWHWATPADSVVPWDRAYSVPTPHWAALRKRHAAQCFRSQFEPNAGSPPVLPPFVLPRMMAVGEVVFR
ncbi:PIG-L deacetylase family protein [Mycobacterium montefiorense]|uniref:Acetylglucosaminylphosphatidylinositol deacetylase n=1 Tax=Mycobacterium montefiorense TaxID=154654 RepID=A0AA37PR08_9MYCO|nr:PIG-L family deacetylase [Mycobacterium montefiorense]GBG36697.1 acetylglucosaminylphosphatidylinositol deacetylase [Mycobacterium montefiorense]GKU37047.1 acetylglucosaminylphosphatidylinositol deacetylase [Mycobacterium montefiorense]GKU43048.1 acetylglucosaminylphosphatidylinositol deacetylase [Mycobacterium montefiorense]GKU48641.1 acetylglucosaminylphosphatidylinositol deacetylase [Mycobacterium montefiorense]GKU50671.1 acetylglucosaminylphosphatidylinositol deacetylase [Mycobacterium 